MDEIFSQAIELAKAQASVRTMTEDQIAEFVRNTATNLRRISAEPVPDESDAAMEPVINPKNSIRERSITCLVCGKKFKILTKTHLESHGLTAKTYREKFGLKKDTALCCKELMKMRKSKMQEMRLWEKRKGKGAAD